MKLFTKFLYVKFIISCIVVITLIVLNQEFIKSHLPLPVKLETKINLIETKDYLNGDPFKIQLWLNQNITGKSDRAVQYAQLPEETFERRTGDCEDYAILAKYFLEKRYEEIYLIVWEGKFLPESKNYEKSQRTAVHCVCIFKIKDTMWGIMDNNGFVMAKGTLEDAIKADVELRYINLKRAFIVKFYRYAYKRIKKLNLEERK